MNKQTKIVDIDTKEFVLNNKIDRSSQNEYYTIVGDGDFIDSNNNSRVNDTNTNKILAKKIIRDDGSIRYQIRIANAGKLYNPVSIYGQEKVNTFLDRVCRTEHKFRDVNIKAFNLYISFLNSKNLSYLHNAERELG